MTSTQGAAQPQQYVVLSTQQPGVTPRPAQTVGYSKKNKQTVKGLALTQLILGFVILVCQTVTTVMDDEASNRAAIINRKHNIDGLLPYGLADSMGTGIWVGMGTVLAAFIGIVGYRKQKKSLISTHLILNVFLLIAYNVLIGTLSATIVSLQACRSYGHYVYRNYYGYYYGSYRTSTTTPAPVLFGEEINLKSGYFHCSHSFFRSWLAIEVILLVCCLIAFFITLTLLIYNSIAVCMCCRRADCCGSCCHSYYNPVSQEVPAVVYSTQQPVQQFVQPQAVPQLQAVPQYYSQPGPIPVQYVQQPMAPAPVQYGQQPMVMAAPVVTYPTAAAPPPAPQPAANNEEGKWEELPPEYRTLAPQSN